MGVSAATDGFARFFVREWNCHLTEEFYKW